MERETLGTRDTAPHDPHRSDRGQARGRCTEGRRCHQERLARADVRGDLPDLARRTEAPHTDMPFPARDNFPAALGVDRDHMHLRFVLCV